MNANKREMIEGGFYMLSHEGWLRLAYALGALNGIAALADREGDVQMAADEVAGLAKTVALSLDAVEKGLEYDPGAVTQKALKAAGTPDARAALAVRAALGAEAEKNAP
ncbi:MAG: hypothetical protein LBU76_08400 [Azoarcus sp.]|jgi:hypothetical protein|nr:hypothetical protein [Azoarcus sp.]